MSKYSLRKKLLMENEEQPIAVEIPAESEEAVATEPDIDADGVADVYSGIKFESGLKVYFSGGYTPSFTVGKGEIGQRVFQAAMPLFKKKGGKEPQIYAYDEEKDETVYLKRPDVTEVLLAMYFKEKENFPNPIVSGDGNPYDVDTGTEKWEVKSLISDSRGIASARTGKHGKALMSPRLHKFRNFVTSIVKIKEVLDGASEEINTMNSRQKEKFQNLGVYCTAVVDEIGDRFSTGELGLTSIGAIQSRTKKEGARGMSTVGENIDKIKRSINTIDCEMENVVVELTVNGKRVPINLSTLSKTKRGDLFALFAATDVEIDGASSSFKEVLNANLLECSILAAADDMLLMKAQEWKRVYSEMTVIGNYYGTHSRDVSVRKRVFEDIIREYFSAAPRITGFCFVTPGGGNIDNYNLLNEEECIKAINTLYDKEKKRYLLEFDSVTQLSPKIVFRSVAFTPNPEAEAKLENVTGDVEEKIVAATEDTAVDPINDNYNRQRMNTLFEWALSGKRYKQ